jgi:hypothetical protein
MADDLTLYEGVDTPLVVTLKDSDGDPINITDYTFLFTVKKRLKDEDVDAIIKKVVTTHTSPTLGITTILITEEDTEDLSGKYLYDLQAISATDNRLVILKKADFVIEQRVGDSFT